MSSSIAAIRGRADVILVIFMIQAFLLFGFNPHGYDLERKLVNGAASVLFMFMYCSLAAGLSAAKDAFSSPGSRLAWSMFVELYQWASLSSVVLSMIHLASGNRLPDFAWGVAFTDPQSAAITLRDYAGNFFLLLFGPEKQIQLLLFGLLSLSAMLRWWWPGIETAAHQRLEVATGGEV